MQAWQKAEMEKAMGGLKSVPITVHKAYVAWQNPADANHKLWRLVAEKDGQLVELHTYTESLTKEGRHDVEMYKDTYMRRCVRNPKG
jgi:hypothetical protein